MKVSVFLLLHNKIIKIQWIYQHLYCENWQFVRCKGNVSHEKSLPMLIWEAFNCYYDYPRLIAATESHENSQDVKE